MRMVYNVQHRALVSCADQIMCCCHCCFHLISMKQA